MTAMLFTLLTYNINYGNSDVDATVQAIASADADVVLLQEITSPWQDVLAARLGKQYPHQAFHVYARAAGGLAVLSKLPIDHEELLPAPERWFPAQRVVIDAPFGKVQVLNVHLRPAIDKGSWVKGYMTTPPIRRREIAAFWKQVATGMPTLVAGDFNESPDGQALAFLADRGLARVPTAGPATWHYQTIVGSRAVDLLRFDLDHVVIDASLAARDARVLDAGTSDHRPVAVTISAK
jgi:endonuclease/exonuclease/phosphatase family metal-dependent hydrolase